MQAISRSSLLICRTRSSSLPISAIWPPRRNSCSSGIVQDIDDAILCLLSIGFEPGDPPSGTIVLNFAGGGTIKLEVECIEAQLDDLGPAWETAHVPWHEHAEAAR